jgi:hypothetical protein
MTMRFVSRLLGVMLVPLMLVAQDPLQVGPAQAVLGPSGATTFTFRAPAAGILTVAVQGSDDLSIAVTDVDGQALPEGTTDSDLHGNVGDETLSLVLPEAGTYRIEVRALGGDGGGTFTVASGFVTMPGFARPADPDGRPSAARDLAVGASHEDVIHPAEGDQRDWYRIRVAEAGTLVILTRVADDFEGDLMLEAFTDGEFAEAISRSDQDLQDNAGRESLTLEVRAGDVLLVRVASVFSSGDAQPYRISVGRMP